MKRLPVIFCFILPALLSGCVVQRPVLVPDRTISPLPAATPVMREEEPLPSPEASELPEPSDPEDARFDKMGVEIKDKGHFDRYISYRELYVYEQDGYTYLDGIIKNEYPDTLVCVLDVCFFEGKEEIARSRVFMGDGSSLLNLSPGETRIYADIKTDMPVTMADLKFETVGDDIAPLKEKG
jgi:hypothetical protein